MRQNIIKAKLNSKQLLVSSFSPWCGVACGFCREAMNLQSSCWGQAILFNVHVASKGFAPTHPSPRQVWGAVHILFPCSCLSVWWCLVVATHSLLYSQLMQHGSISLTDTLPTLSYCWLVKLLKQAQPKDWKIVGYTEFTNF